MSGYGEFAFYGTEQEAEEMRAHKSTWEGGVGYKNEVPKNHPLVREAKEQIRWELEHGYGLEERELASIEG